METPVNQEQSRSAARRTRHEVCFEAPGQVRFRPASGGLPKPDWGHYLIETECSVISAGTEQAILRGIEGWAPLPYVPGYGSVGRILECGPGATMFKPGDRVFTHGQHASIGVTRNIVVPVPEGMDPALAAMARLAAVAVTALRVSDAEYGDSVAVLGLGVIGNFAAQMFARSGCDVIAVDPSERRRQIARECGIETVLHPDEATRETIDRLTKGERCASVIDVSGLTKVVEKAPLLCRPLGELIMLGSPRDAHLTNLTAFLQAAHDMSGVTIKGAHEWRAPVTASPNFRYVHSIERNSRQMLDHLARGKLVAAPLLTHRIAPERAAEAYAGLQQKPEEWLGVVFDWKTRS